MTEQTAGPSTTPIIPISTNEQSLSDENSSSASASPTLTALETLASLEPPPSELKTAEPTESDEFPTVPAVQQQQIPISPPEPSPPGGSSGNTTTPPRTQSGAPVSLKRNKVSTKRTKCAENTQINEHAPWHGVVVDYAPQKEQAVIFPAKMVYSSPNIPYNDEGWAFQRATGYSDYIGSGFVFINVHGEKRKRNVKDNTYVSSDIAWFRSAVIDNLFMIQVFIVLEGAVEVLIHQTSYAVSAGGVFVVPRGSIPLFSQKLGLIHARLHLPPGNFYTIRNISEKEAKLFFTQTRKPEPEVTLDTKGTNRPTSKTFLLAEWFLKHLVTYFLRLRSKAFDLYWYNLARYQHHFTTRRLYLLFFVFGLIIRRLPFIGSPPMLNIQILSATRDYIKDPNAPEPHLYLEGRL
ncbi:hypothetical protein C0995_002629 [Termitomyces sp. Mi166|nr:hypothetical protein C0995_002629 [Termitomyces sp. Mi166\